MSTLAYFRARPDYAMGRAFLLTFAVHAVLLVFMFIGVRMQNRPDETVSVELWEAPPPPPPPVVEAPKPPPPKVEAPKPEPEPEVKKPEIVEKAPPPKPKKPEPKKAEAKAPPKDDLEKLLLREQVAMEQEKLNAERRQIDEARRKADSEKTARQLAATARDKALGQYISQIRRKVQQSWILPQDLQGNIAAVFEIVQLPSGDVISIKLIKSSGNPAYDAAVERGIIKASPLPLPEPRSLFDRKLIVTFPSREQS